MDRKGRINAAPRVNFTRCLLRPDLVPTPTFDDRGISFDAGNTEYPVVYGLNNSTISDCLFDQCGVAYSRCRFSRIEGSDFNDRFGDTDLLHIEEFSNNIVVQGNQFICRVPETRANEMVGGFVRGYTKICQLDRELQITRDVQFRGNFIDGNYNFFINGYAPDGLLINNNTFRNNAIAGNENSIGLNNYESSVREPIPGNIVSNNVTITNNTGLRRAANNSFEAIFARGNNPAPFTIPVNQYPNGRRNITRENTLPALIANGVYNIRSVGNRQILGANGTSGIRTVANTLANRNNTANQWRVTFVPPYSYNIQNVGNGNFLETHKGYTENDIQNRPNELNLIPFLNAAPANARPFWAFRRFRNVTPAQIEIFPGGNERQSILDVNGGNIRLNQSITIPANGGARASRPVATAWRWIFAAVNNTAAKEIIGNTVEDKLSLRSNPVKTGDRFTIEGITEGNVISIFSATGSFVKEVIATTSQTISTEGMSSGIYFIQINHTQVLLKTRLGSNFLDEFFFNQFSSKKKCNWYIIPLRA